MKVAQPNGDREVAEAITKVYAGIDLHSTNSVLGFVDENGQLLRERQYPNELPVIIEALTPYREQLVGQGDVEACSGAHHWARLCLVPAS